MTRTPTICRRPYTKRIFGLSLLHSLALPAVIALCALCTGASFASQIVLPKAEQLSLPSAAHLYRLSLLTDQLYDYTGRQFITTWRDDGTVFASVADVSHLAPKLDKVIYSAPRSRSGVTILSDDARHQEWTYLPRRNVLVHAAETASQTPDPAAELHLLLTNYRFSVASKPVLVAGRKSYLVEVQRRKAGRPFEHLWIDPFTGFVLRQERFMADGSLVSVTYYEQLKFHPKIDQADFDADVWSSKKPRKVEEAFHAEQQIDTHELPSPFSSLIHVAQNLDGYSLESATLLHKPQGDSLHLLYSDGLYPLSLYATPRHTSKPTTMAGSHRVSITPTEMGQAIERYSYWLVNWDTPGMTYTVAGEASLPSMLSVAREQYLGTALRRAPQPGTQAKRVLR